MSSADKGTEPVSVSSLTVFKPKPDLPPPPLEGGWIGWIWRNLFGSLTNTALTLIFVYLAWQAFSGLWHWGVTSAIWDAASRRECLDRSPFGACWAGVTSWFGMFMYGRYPESEIWRVNLGGIILLVWAAPLLVPRVSGKAFIAIAAPLLYPFLAVALFLGGDRGSFQHTTLSLACGGLTLTWLHVLLCLTIGPDWLKNLSLRFSEKEVFRLWILTAIWMTITVFWATILADVTLPLVKTVKWGGLFLTMILAITGMITALPSGIILALGRRSGLPFIRALCVVYIESIRSVPLIGVLFMATTMIPLFLPVDVIFDKLALVLIAICMFSAAYMAETIRGGLQAIPKDQYDAAASVGLSPRQTMWLVVIPQALRLMIPNIVGSFIGLFKDTGVVSIVGLYDLVAMLKAVSGSPRWIGLHFEPFFIAAVIYFTGCLAMSRYSLWLHRRLNVGEKKREF